MIADLVQMLFGINDVSKIVLGQFRIYFCVITNNSRNSVTLSVTLASSNLGYY